MPAAEIIFFREANGNIPVRTFLRTLLRSEQKACWEAILLLQMEGSEIAGKHAKNLGGGVWELRVIAGRVHIRLLFGFVGQQVVLLTHGITKEGAVPLAEIRWAQDALKAYANDPETHSR
jgi:phage-related protein